MNEFPDWLSSTLAPDATAGRGVLPPWIGPLKPGVRAVDLACIALMSQDDNLSVREAIWDTYTNQASATVLSAGEDCVVYYQVDGCESTVCRPVSFSTWRSIVEQTR